MVESFSFPLILIGFPFSRQKGVATWQKSDRQLIMEWVGLFALWLTSSWKALGDSQTRGPYMVVITYEETRRGQGQTTFIRLHLGLGLYTAKQLAKDVKFPWFGFWNYSTE